MMLIAKLEKVLWLERINLPSERGSSELARTFCIDETNADPAFLIS